MGNAPAFPVINGMLADQIADKTSAIADKQASLNAVSREPSDARKAWEAALAETGRHQCRSRKMAIPRPSGSRQL